MKKLMIVVAIVAFQVSAMAQTSTSAPTSAPSEKFVPMNQPTAKPVAPTIQAASAPALGSGQNPYTFDQLAASDKDSVKKGSFVEGMFSIPPVPLGCQDPEGFQDKYQAKVSEEGQKYQYLCKVSQGKLELEWTMFRFEKNGTYGSRKWHRPLQIGRCTVKGEIQSIDWLGGVVHVVLTSRAIAGPLVPVAEPVNNWKMHPLKPG